MIGDRFIWVAFAGLKQYPEDKFIDSPEQTTSHPFLSRHVPRHSSGNLDEGQPGVRGCEAGIGPADKLRASVNADANNLLLMSLYRRTP